MSQMKYINSEYRVIIGHDAVCHGGSLTKKKG